MRTIEAIGGGRRIVVISVIGSVILLLAVWASRPWQQRLLVDQWNEQIERLPDDEVQAAVDRLAGTGAVAIRSLVDAIGSPRQVVAEAAYRALIRAVEEQRGGQGHRGQSVDRHGEPLVVIARRLAGSVSSYGPAGRRRAARIAHRLLIRSFDRDSPDSMTLIADCETILGVAARTEAVGRIVGKETGSDGGHGWPGPFPSEHPGRRPATVEDPLGQDFSVQSAEFLADLPWFTGDHTSPAVSATAEGDARSSRDQTAGNDAAVGPSGDADRPAGEAVAASSPLLTPPRRLDAPPEATRLPRSGRTPSRGVHAASGERPADGEAPPNNRTDPVLDRGDLTSISTRQLIRALSGSEEEAARAATRLAERGFGTQQMEVARRLADPDPAVRRRLVEQVVRLAGIDPRRWLLWLSEDGHADVRLAALTVMATSKDPRLLRRVEQSAARDPDPRIQRLADRLGSGRDADR